MAYSLKYYKEFTRNHGTHCLEIYEKDYSGSAIEIDNLQGDILITMDGSDITDAIIGSTLSFTIIDTSQIDYTEFFTPDSTKYKVVFKTNNTTRWTGYLTPDSYKENLAYREPITLTARDNTGRLNDFYFDENAWQMMTVNDVFSLAKNTAGIDMALSYNSQVQTSGNVRIPTALINTNAFIGLTWREVIENILTGLGCQMRWCDNNYIGIFDLSQLYELDAEGSTQQMRFINKSGYKEIKPAWKQLDITQNYMSTINIYNSTDYLTNNGDIINSGEQVVGAAYIPVSGKSWQITDGESDTHNPKIRLSNQYVCDDDNQLKSIFITGFHYGLFAGTEYWTNAQNYIKLSKVIPSFSESVIIKFLANNTLRQSYVDHYATDGVNLAVPGTFLAPPTNYTPSVMCNIFFLSNGIRYILRDEWVEYNSADYTGKDQFLIFPLDKCDWGNGAVNIDKEISIFIQQMPIQNEGTLEIVIYPFNTGYSVYTGGVMKLSNFEINVGTTIDSGQHLRTVINSVHNINAEVETKIGQTPNKKAFYLNYHGGLYSNDAHHPPLINWKLDSLSETTYNLLELVAREHIHFNKDNYLLLSGQMIPETLTDYIHFDRPFLYSATRYVPISFDYNVISNSINITKMQEVREYEVEDLTFEDVSDDDCGSSSSSGSSSSGGASSSGTTDHTRLANRDVSDQHPLSSITGLVDALAAKLDITTFSDLFEKVNIGTTESPIYVIRAKYNFSSIGWITARGYNSESGGGSSDYTRLDTWTGYNNSTMAGYVLSAGLGYDMVTRIASLESGSALSVVSSGSGNAVTSVAKSGTEITIVKGSTFSLSGHNHDAAYVPTTRTIAGLALSADVGVSSLQNALGLGTAAYTASTSYAAASHTHTKAQITDFPTELSQFNNDRGFITSGASISGSSDSLRILDTRNINPTPNDISKYKLSSWFSNSGTPNDKFWSGITLKGWSDSYAVWQLCGLAATNTSNQHLYVRNGIGSTWNNWRGLAYVDELADYLPLSGGTISGSGAELLKIDSSNQSYNAILFKINGVAKSEFGYNYFCSYIYDYTSAKYLGIDVNGTPFFGPNSVSGKYTLLHSGNYNSYSPTLTGTGASGTWGINISGNAATATNADTLDGYHETGFYRAEKRGIPSGDLASLEAGSYFAASAAGDTNPLPSTYASLSVLGKSYYSQQLCVTYNATRAWLRGIINSTTITVSDWHELAFTDSNVASATKLQTPRTIWGQSFDGSGNVSGAMTGVSTISASGNITTNGNITSVGYITSQSYITARIASDMRLKDNIQTINNGLSIIRQLRPIEADWNSIAERLNPHDHKGHLASFIAQEYMNVLPFATRKMSDGYFGIDNTAVIPYLTSAVTEVDDKVTRLEKRVQYLESELQKYKTA